MKNCMYMLRTHADVRINLVSLEDKEGHDGPIFFVSIGELSPRS